MPSGSVLRDAQGDREFSVILAWVTDQPGAPPVSVVDEIVGSAQVRGEGTPP